VGNGQGVVDVIEAADVGSQGVELVPDPLAVAAEVAVEEGAAGQRTIELRDW
jgi:hypothetical protein